MTIWQYDNYITQSTSALRESVLRQHIQEVSAVITADVSKGGSSRSSSGLIGYLDGLKAELEKLENANAPRVTFAKLGRR